MPQNTDVVIIGGGAAGCSTAYFLAKAGVKSTIIEREGIGSQASGMSAGGLNPLQGAGIPGPLAPLAMESFRMHKEMEDELIETSGVDFQPQMVAMVKVAFEEAELPALQETLDIFEGADGFAAHWMENEHLYRTEPRLGKGILRALYHYGNAALNSGKFTLALAKAAESMGASILHAEVRGLRTSGGRVTGVVLEDGEVGCDAVVVASGPWTGEAEGWLETSIPVRPLKGEIVRMEPPAGPVLAHEYSTGDVNLFQRLDGIIWVGATEEDQGFDKEPSEAGERRLMDGAIKLMPAMADAKKLMHTACLRPVTADWLPIIGKAPGWDNAYLATGAGKKGILISPGIGKSVADLITQGSTELSVEHFGLERFS